MPMPSMGVAGGVRSYEPRHGPSKLRMSSSDVPNIMQGLHIPSSTGAAAHAGLQVRS
jgi:hypothetical protein